MEGKTQNWGKAFEALFQNENPVREEKVRFVLDVGENGSKTYICELWKGVFLWANDIHTDYFEYPDDALSHKNYAVLNICLSGRCEVSFVDDRYVYMSPGLFNANCTMPRDGYSYPGSVYEGIEVAFDMDILGENVPPELSSFGLTIHYLEELLQRGNGNFMAVISDEMYQKSRFLYESLIQGNFSLPDYRFLTVSLLYHLKNGSADEYKGTMTVTKGQRHIAREVEKRLTADFRRHFTVEELADEYGISPSALKKYFEQVFGLPISYYLRAKRMETAKEMLTETRESVGVIASACGYENQGKFGSAFKAFAGVSPLEYRRLYQHGKEV